MTNMAPPPEKMRRLLVFTLRPTNRVVKGTHTIREPPATNASNQEKIVETIRDG